jgi:hypothetical protein
MDGFFFFQKYPKPFFGFETRPTPIGHSAISTPYLFSSKQGLGCFTANSFACSPPKQRVLLKGQYNMAGSRSGRSGKSGWAGLNAARRAVRLAANSQSKAEEGRQIPTPHP